MVARAFVNGFKKTEITDLNLEHEATVVLPRQKMIVLFLISYLGNGPWHQAGLDRLNFNNRTGLMRNA